MNNPSQLDRMDTALSVLQRATIIVSALIAGWYVILRQDHSVHVQIAVQARMLKGCLLATEVTLRNPKGIILEPDSLTIQVWRPDLREVIDLPDNSLRVTEQVRQLTESSFKVGELVRYSQILPVRPEPTDTALVIVAQLAVDQGTFHGIYSDEQILEITRCAAS